MSIWTPLTPYRFEIEIGLAAALIVALSIAQIKHDHKEQAIGAAKILAADKAGVERQKKEDQAKIKVAESTHGKELDDIKNAYLNPIPVADPTRLYVHSGSPNNVRETPVRNSSSPSAPVVQDDGAVHQDREAAYELLLKRADGLSADTRELNTEIH